MYTDRIQRIQIPSTTIRLKFPVDTRKRLVTQIETRGIVRHKTPLPHSTLRHPVKTSFFFTFACVYFTVARMTLSQLFRVCITSAPSFGKSDDY